MIEPVINEATMIANQLERTRAGLRALIYADHAVVVRTSTPGSWSTQTCRRLSSCGAPEPRP